jgi:hypothetical protein
MKETIHKTMVLAMAFMLSGLFITFCTQSVENRKDGEGIVNTDEILKEFQTVGLLHNKVMAEVLDDFRNHDGGFEDREGYFAFMEESLVNNLSTKDLLQGMKTEEIRALVVDELARTRSHYQAKKEKVLEFESYLQSIVSEFDGVLSAQQIDILRRIENIINNSLTVEMMIISLEMVNNSPEVLALDYEDRMVIYAATSVGIESATYWSAHFQEWVEVLMYSDPSELNFQKIADAGFFDSVQWFSGRRMVDADVAGGVGGAVGGCMAGSLAGGVGCLPGAFTWGLIGAAGGSVTNAMLQILDQL